jgi:hypothetical protein
MWDFGEALKDLGLILALFAVTLLGVWLALYGMGLINGCGS